MASSIFSLKPGEWSRDCSKGIRNSFGFYVENGYPKHLPCERDNGNSKRFLREVPQRLTGDPNYRYLSFCILLTLSQARLSVSLSHLQTQQNVLETKQQCREENSHWAQWTWVLLGEKHELPCFWIPTWGGGVAAVTAKDCHSPGEGPAGCSMCPGVFERFSFFRDDSLFVKVT